MCAVLQTGTTFSRVFAQAATPSACRLNCSIACDSNRSKPKPSRSPQTTPSSIRSISSCALQSKATPEKAARKTARIRRPSSLRLADAIAARQALRTPAGVNDNPPSSTQHRPSGADVCARTVAMVSIRSNHKRLRHPPRGISQDINARSIRPESCLGIGPVEGHQGTVGSHRRQSWWILKPL